ncbi:UDP-glucuronic acid decarboxylase family protein [Candidatus Atelocyanobacterium thalassae]|uniref:UDP-glucuronate decarboxylase n=2 Tax=Candidatus Atelocyanobacterium thalassae TaxID=713887 RepID=A0A086CGJ8_9CHRO|nr:UDP-glucuronic acid decarboxylase family protein [Candidatus Atelocyanobacterium thalassa]KFF41312.1 MAG: nucleoside-diphosphate-sugar epimerase [Candidatus Atelocyanobacterium thalassa isolate SIO64986]BDA39370.1 UDP-glucose 4-epimerase [cyanobacterium endosymbiont of Braarudosphaera bigelowii]
MKILVTGGAGFIGSHLIDRLMEKGYDVLCLDNFYTGSKNNVFKWIGNPCFELIRHDITEPIRLEVDRIYHLACPASPIHYQHNPVKTIKTNVLGTLNMLGLAKRVNARILLASTSEVYGDPDIHPQHEEYNGNVNCTGLRACYDEGKRVAETLAFEYHREHKTDIRVARIFNTYGPRMSENDGRVVSNLIVQALQNKFLTIYGDGSQTRSFCYISDMAEGLIRLMNGNYIGPINLGNPDEYTILELAKTIQKMTKSNAQLIYKELPKDDPKKRQPDITKAKLYLDWQPKFSLQKGLELTIQHFQGQIFE